MPHDAVNGDYPIEEKGGRPRFKDIILPGVTLDLWRVKYVKRDWSP